MSASEEQLLNNTSDNFNAPRFSQWEYRNIALAVIVQCAQLVNSLATSGRADSAQMEACIAPLLVLDPDNVGEIYPDVSRFSSGLNALQKSLDKNGMKEFGEPIRYVLGMTVLQQQLGKVSSMQSLIRRRLKSMRALRTAATHDSEQLEVTLPPEYDFGTLAEIYQDTISKLTFRIHVKGDPEYLKDQRVADKIRALLLAGIRSAMLWQQLGGRRWHLFFYKTRIRESVIHVRRSLMTVH